MTWWEGGGGTVVDDADTCRGRMAGLRHERGARAHILELQVAMDDAPRVAVGDGRDERLECGPCGALREAAAIGQPVEELATRRHLEEHPPVAVDVRLAVEGDDILVVVHQLHQSHLLREGLALRLVVKRHEFRRHVAVPFALVDAAEDVAEAAITDTPVDHHCPALADADHARLWCVRGGRGHGDTGFPTVCARPHEQQIRRTAVRGHVRRAELCLLLHAGS